MPSTSRLMLQAAASPVHLKDGDDAQAAAQLRAYLHEAEDGLRRVLICGAYLDHIVSRLPHGTCDKWLAQHVPEVNARTVRRWRELYSDLLTSIGSKRTHVSAISGGPVALLAAPVEELPAEAQELRAKIDAQIAGKTARQLFLQFRSADEDEEGNLRIKVGRRAGEGGREADPTSAVELVPVRAQRAKNKIAKSLKLVLTMGTDWVLMDDHDLSLWSANLDAMSKAVRHWLDTPKPRRDAQLVAKCDKIQRGKA